MSDPLGGSLRPAPADPPFEEDEVNLLDGSAEPTDDSPTVISKAPPSPASKTDGDFSGSLRGRRLAHFELIEPIGVGGMAAVLRARDTQLDRQVALKILPPEMACDPENVRRFHQEARSAARLDHENIARVFFCGEDQRLHFIAFEFVEGENLRTILERRGRLPVSEALNYMLQVAAGLAHAAGRGVVHRDIKPSNIIITPNGRAKLVDMGLARSLEPQHDLGLTQSGVTLGTFDYISPEQALEPRDADVRSDIYSLGCTFYHMLTGHPPVPEGTAAKKLHHHQHVKPPDPRQFVPDLPDEAAVILDRMMAKLPKDRYQQPEHLVHHLYLAARKLGAAAEIPEGVLAVEAALPNPPTGRPLVLAALAAIAVVGLIFFLDQFSTRKPEPTQPSAAPTGETANTNSSSNPPEPTPAPTTNKKGPETPVNPRQLDEQEKKVAIFSLEKPTATDLAEFLQKNKQRREIILELEDLDLQHARDDRQPDLVITNPIVTIRPRTPGRRPTVRDAYNSQLPKGIQASFTIQSETSCTIENIRFVLDQTGADVPMAALLFRGTKQATVRRCEFIQAHPSGNGARMTAVLDEAVLDESRKPAKLSLSESCFLGFAELETTVEGAAKFSKAASGGQDAITRRGPVVIEATNCVFGPHAAVFRLEGAAGDDESLVQVEHASVLLGNHSAVFDVADDASARIVAHCSLFSRPGDPGMSGMGEGKGAVLVRQASSPGSVHFNGRQNRYHQLDNYWIGSDPGEVVRDFSEELKTKDEDSRELTGEPWKDDQPLKQLEKLAVQEAFQVNPLLPALRLPTGDGQLVGAEKVLTFSYVANLPPLKEKPAKEGRRELIVENRKKLDNENLRYPTLNHALVDARPGDVIRLRLNGELKLDSQHLSGEHRADLTLRADPGFHPVLTLSDTKEGNAALFDVYNGRLRLENLELRLRPRGDDTDPQAVVFFLGDGECVLKDCILTLDRAGRKTALAMLPETRKPGQGPRLTLENCFVRGQGSLVCAHGGQFAELKIHKSLIALTGSLLSVESDKELLAPEGEFALHLSKCTTYLGGHLIHLRSAKDLKSVAKIYCEPEDCLFLPASERAPALVRLEGPDSEMRDLKDKLSWSRGGKNAYGSFATFLEQQPLGAMLQMSLQTDLEKWKDMVSGERESEYNVKLSAPPAVDAPLTQLLPSAFRITEKGLKDYGADLGALPMLHKIDLDELEDFGFPDSDLE